MIKSIVKFKQLEDRIDAEYYKPEYSRIIKIIGQYIKLSSYLIKNNRGKQPEYSSINSDYYVLKTRDVDGSFCNEQNLPAVSEKSYRSSESAQLLSGDVILNSTGIGSICRPAIWYSSKKAVVDGHVTILRASKISQELLFVYLLSNIGQKLLEREISGATGQIEIYPINIGSVAFSNSLVKISNYIKELVRLSFEKLQKSDKKYREVQGLLNKYLGVYEQKFEFPKAFSLRFSELDDRFDGEFYRPKAIQETPLFNKGTFKLGDLAIINMGKTPAKHNYTQKGVRILKVRDLTNKGINWSEGERAFTKQEVWDKSEKSRIQVGDILLISAAHQAYYIGKEFDIVFDVPKIYENKLLGVAELLIIRSNKTINPYVLLWYLRTPIAYQCIQKLITGETSHLYPKDLVNLPIPKTLSNFKHANKVEKLTKESILLQKESKQLLKKAKKEVEEIIEKGE